MENPKFCLCCSHPLKGRIDKKFCDDGCRNNYNNRYKAEKNNTIRNINNALLKNRRILEEFLTEGTQLVKKHREQLLVSGFNFNYHTHSFTNANGALYRYCYDYGYLELDRDTVLVLKAIVGGHSNQTINSPSQANRKRENR